MTGLRCAIRAWPIGFNGLCRSNVRIPLLLSVPALWPAHTIRMRLRAYCVLWPKYGAPFCLFMGKKKPALGAGRIKVMFKPRNN